MWKRVWLAFGFVFWASSVFAQVAFDAATDGTNNGGSTSSLTWSHTVSGSNRIGLVGCLGDNITGGSDDITGVTWNSVAMSLLTKYTTPDLTSNRFQYVYYLVAPATGSHSIVVSSGSNHYLLCGSLSYTGAAQSGNPVQFATNTAASGSAGLTTSLTTTVDNSWTVMLSQGSGFGSSPPPAPTGGTGTTFRVTSAAFRDWSFFDSNGVIHPAGSTSLISAYSGNSTIGIIQTILSIKPVAPTVVARRTPNSPRTGTRTIQ